MRKLLSGMFAPVLFLACLTFSAAALQVPPASPGQSLDIIGYVYLSGPAMTESCFFAASVPDTFTLWIWLEPLENGLTCAEFKILLPENVTATGESSNPAIGMMTGSVTDPGVELCFTECRYEPVWTHQVTCVVTDYQSEFIHLDYNQGSGPNEGEDCSAPSVTGEIRSGGIFGINTPAAVEESSWGAIKAVYDR